MSSDQPTNEEEFNAEFGDLCDPNKRAEVVREVAAQMGFQERESAARELLETRRRYHERESANTDAFRGERYDLTAGRQRRYIGVTRGIGGEIEFELAEYTLVTDSITLSREEALALIAGLQKLTK